MYFSSDETPKALNLYQEIKTVTKTVRKLGYPTNWILYSWIKNEGKEKRAVCLNIQVPP